MKVKGNYIRAMINKLTDDGQKLINKAFEQADYSKNKTQNLHDSYGSAVYYNGSLVNGTMRFLTSRAAYGKYNDRTDRIEYGREEITDFLQSYKAPMGLSLVVAVAMFYGTILEAGAQGGLRRKYHVISQIGDDVDMFVGKIEGARKLQIGGEL